MNKFMGRDTMALLGTLHLNKRNFKLIDRKAKKMALRCPQDLKQGILRETWILTMMNINQLLLKSPLMAPPYKKKTMNQIYTNPSQEQHATIPIIIDRGQ